MDWFIHVEQTEAPLEHTNQEKVWISSYMWNKLKHHWNTQIKRKYGLIHTCGTNWSTTGTHISRESMDWFIHVEQTEVPLEHTNQEKVWISSYMWNKLKHHWNTLIKRKYGLVHTCGTNWSTTGTHISRESMDWFLHVEQTEAPLEHTYQEKVWIDSYMWNKQKHYWNTQIKRKYGLIHTCGTNWSTTETHKSRESMDWFIHMEQTEALLEHTYQEKVWIDSYMWNKLKHYWNTHIKRKYGLIHTCGTNWSTTGTHKSRESMDWFIHVEQTEAPLEHTHIKRKYGLVHTCGTNWSTTGTHNSRESMD